MPVVLSRAAQTRSGSPLPDPWPALASSKFGVKFLRGQLVMLAGPPGAGKTMLALDGVLKMGSPTLYFSADSDELTMATRAASALTHHPQHVVRKVHEAGLFRDQYGGVLDAIPMQFVFDPSEPSVEDIAMALDAWVELWGEYPHLIVVDNLMNLRAGGGDEWTAMRQTAKDLQYLARKTRACVWVLHHTSEENPAFVKRDAPERLAPPRAAIQGKVSQLPAVILTVDSRDGEMWVGVVKNRNGEQDRDAKQPLRFEVNFSTMVIKDQPNWIIGGRSG